MELRYTIHRTSRQTKVSECNRSAFLFMELLGLPCDELHSLSFHSIRFHACVQASAHMPLYVLVYAYSQLRAMTSSSTFSSRMARS